MSDKNKLVLDDNTTLTKKQLDEFNRIYKEKGKEAAEKYLDGVTKSW